MKIIYIFMFIFLAILVFQKIHKKNTRILFDNQIKELTDVSSKEKDVLKEVLIDNLNNDYKLIKKLRVGQSSMSYLIENEKKEKFVLKMPSDLQSDSKKWLNDQLLLYSQISSTLEGYSGDIKVPICVNSGNCFVVEKYLGEELNEELLQKLDMNDRDKICKQFADFLVFLHNNKCYEKEVSPVTLPDFFKLEDCFEYIKPILSTNQRKKFLNTINQFNNRNFSDEIITKVHYDLRLPNILYNEENKTLAVIDFECVRDENVYYDFCPRVAPRFPIDMIFDIIRYYNQESCNKVDFGKVKLFYDVFSIYEICTCAKFRDNVELTDAANENSKQVCTAILNIVENFNM